MSAAAIAAALPPPNVAGAVPHCAVCGTALMVCACEGKAHGEDVVFVLEGGALPETATPLQRVARWRDHALINPSTAAFDASRFCDDMLGHRQVLQVFPRLRPRLEAMAEDYCRSGLRGPSGQSILDIFRAQGAQYSLEQGQAEVRQAVQRFLSFDWSRLSSFDLALVNNVYQSSDPVQYPVTDQDLQLGADVLGCLMQVNKMASSRLSYSFEPFDWQ